MNALQSLRSIPSSILDFLYPPLCLHCSALLIDRESFLCDACLPAIRTIAREDPVFRGIHDALCADGMIDDVIAPFWFDKRSPLQAVIHALKYQDLPAVGDLFGRDLGRSVRKAGVTPTVILPVPLHRAKLREREYNQAVHIARGASSALGTSVCESFLVRRRYTKTQTDLTAAERKRNVEGAFAVHDGASLDSSDLRCVLLVDDVLTTGATTRALAHVLKKRGCGRLIVGTVAVAARSV